jgi:hypothetical protein
VLSAEKAQLENQVSTQQPRQQELLDRLQAELARYQADGKRSHESSTSALTPTQAEIQFKLRLSKKQSEVDAATFRLTTLTTAHNALQRENVQLKQKLYNVLTGIDDDISDLDMSVLEDLQHTETDQGVSTGVCACVCFRI